MSLALGSLEKQGSFKNQLDKGASKSKTLPSANPRATGAANILPVLPDINRDSNVMGRFASMSENPYETEPDELSARI